MTKMKIVVLIAFFVVTAVVCIVFAFSKSSAEVTSKYAKLKTEEIDSIPDDELESAVVEWLFSKIDSKGTTEVPIVRAMLPPCRYVYATYIVTTEVMSRGFGECFEYVNSYLLSSAVEGFIEMGADKLAEIVEKACMVAGKHIAENGRGQLGMLTGNEELEQLSDEFAASDDTEKLSDTILNYIKENKDYFGD